MRLFALLVLIVFSIVPILAQDSTFVEIDSLYREDQFYASITYNLLTQKPSGVSQSGFSSGFHVGFIRDIPINKKRDLALGIGLGYSGSSYNQNLQIGKDDMKNVTYQVLTGGNDYTRNKFALHLLEVPFEFRWRSSSVSDYKFWRIYTGFKVGYLITHTTKYIGSPNNQQYSDIDHFNDFHYGLTTSFGYNTWNVHLYYGLNSIFNNKAQLNNQHIDLKSVKIGLIFYLL
ncbi:MAG: PorT family protein [Bacteroidia bacterium]|nr:PorT family protein [Bacteroidia bacterium]NNK28297.1 PorT family protein [Flavobacteriaceae bacterium]